MVRPSAPPRRRLWIAAAASLPLLLGTRPVAAGDPPPMPPAETFRTIQLTTLACGRDNSAEPCERARKLADPLLDHPRLSASCKDALWSIRQRAVVDPAGNSLARRDPIDRAANDVLAFCRQRPRPKDKPGNPAGGPPQGSGGFGFSTGQPQR